MRIPGQYASFDCMEKQGFGQNRQLNICESRALHLNLVGAVPFSIHLIAFLLLWTDESFERRALHTSSQFHTWHPNAMQHQTIRLSAGSGLLSAKTQLKPVQCSV